MNIKKALLHSLVCAEQFKSSNSEAEKLFQNIAMNIYHSNIPVIKSQVNEMIDSGSISKNGQLTFEGKLQTINNVHEYGPNHLGIETNKHIRECLRRGTFGTTSKGKGVLSFLRDEELSKILECVLDECFTRTQMGTNATTFLTQDSSAYIVELDSMISKELTVISGSNEVIDVVNEVIVEVQQEIAEPKAKKSRKKVVV